MALSAGAGILAEYYILLVIAFFLIVARGYVRLRITKRNSQDWGWDDTCIIIAWILLLIGAVIMQMEVDLGLGKHITDIKNPEGPLGILKWRTFFQMVHVLCALITKISISLYILRIRDDNKLRWLLVVLMTFMTLATIAVIVVFSISCRPLRKLWEPNTPGTCLELAPIYNVAYVQSAFTIIVDLCLSLVPVYILWNVQIKTGKKTFICFLMSLGLIATISNALRNLFQTGLTTPDFTYDMTNVTVVAILELASGIIAACIPTCVGLLRVRKKKIERHTGNTSSLATSASLQTPKATLNSISGRHYATLGDEDEHDLLPLGRISPNGAKSIRVQDTAHPTVNVHNGVA